MRKGGLEIQKPRGEGGKRRQRQRQARSGMGPSRGDWSAPRRGSSHPLRSLTLTARGHGRSAPGAARRTQLGTPGAVAGVRWGAMARAGEGVEELTLFLLHPSPCP